jgi:hypothetical protein
MLAVAALAVAGCGSSSGSGSGSSSGSTSSSQDAARVKLSQCLRDHGVDIPDNPGQGGGGAPQNIDRTKVQAAMQACRKYQSAAFGNVSASQQQEFRDAFTKFSACMRQHGVEVPDVAQGGGPPAGGQQLNRDDPKTKAAIQACQSKLPQRGSGGPAGPGGGGQP